MKNKVEFFVTNCKIGKFERYAMRPLYEENGPSYKKGELLEIDLHFVLESSGETFKIPDQLIKNTIASKAMKGVEQLIFKVPMKKEFTEADMLLFTKWYEEKDQVDLKAGLKLWKKEKYNKY